jgi:ribosome-associated protein
MQKQMNPEDIIRRNVEQEFAFATSRSSGPGGQNVNKVSSKVELRFSLIRTSLFSEEEKALIFIKLKNKINLDGELILVSQSERTQVMNRKAVTEKFYRLIAQALTVQAPRRPSKPTNASKLRRLNEKKAHSIIKKYRKVPGKTEE